MAVPDTDSFTLLNVVDEVNPSTDDLYQSFEESFVSNFDSRYIPSGFNPHKDDKTNYEQLYFRNYGNDQYSGIVAEYSRFIKLYTAGPYLVALTDTNYVVVFKIWDTGDIVLIDEFNQWYNNDTGKTEVYHNLRDAAIYYDSSKECAYLFIGFIFDELDDGDGTIRWQEIKIDDREGADAYLSYFDSGTDGDLLDTDGSQVDSIVISDYDPDGSPRTVILVNSKKDTGSSDIEIWSYFYHLDGSKCGGSVKDNTTYHSELTNKGLVERSHSLIDRNITTNTSYFASQVYNDSSGGVAGLRVRELNTTLGANWGQMWEVDIDSNDTYVFDSDYYFQSFEKPMYARPYQAWYEIFVGYMPKSYYEGQEIRGYKFDYSNPGLNLVNTTPSDERYSNHFADDEGWVAHSISASEDNIYVIKFKWETTVQELTIFRFSYTYNSIEYRSKYVLTTPDISGYQRVVSITSSLTDSSSDKDIIYMMLENDGTYRYSLYIIEVEWDNSDPSNDSYTNISLPA